MLESFQIKNFRLFENVEVRKLSRVNLIVGKNNVGKSTFLEALVLYASNADSTTLLELLESRQQTWVSEAKSHSGNFNGNHLRHIFYGHKLPEIGHEGISLGEIISSAKLRIGVAAYQLKNDEETSLRKIRLADVLDEDLPNIQIFLVADEGERTRRLFNLDSSRRNFYPNRGSESKYEWQMVPTANISNRKLAALWDLTSLTSLESEVISALRLIDDRVTGVAFVEDVSRVGGRENRIGLGSRDNRIPLVKILGIDEPFPLKSMGDGMTRLFQIIVALVNAKNGLLLIDEFETGLHWTVQSKAWDIVFELSNRLNVQVFATTHSCDCIEGFGQAWNNNPDLGAFFRLYTNNGIIKAAEYTPETLIDSIDMDVEVR